MKRFALAILLVAACSGKSKPPTTAGTGSGSGSAIYAKKIVVSWGISPSGSGADVFLQTTDETGKQLSHALGTYAGECRVIKPAEDMKAVTGVNCTANDKGVELDATVVRDEIVVLKMDVQVGVAPDPMSRVEVLRFKAPGGAAIEAAETP